MNTSRRKFIRDTGMGTLGLSLLSSFTNIENIIGLDAPISLPRMSPESQGVSSAGIRNFIKAANASGLNWHSFMLLRHGKVVAEGWWKPFESQYHHTLYSLSKSFTSTAIGLLVKEGKITVEDPVTSFFKDELPNPVPDNLAKMKIKHLLTMNSGHAEDTLPKMREASDAWTKTFLQLPLQYEPGTHFLYNTGATYMLGAIVHKVTGQKLEDYLSPRLFQPLDIKGLDWETSPQGLNTAGYGLRVKTEDIARFGQLYLQKGKWNGKQILTPEWIEEASSKHTNSNPGDGDWSQGYGYQFWRCKPGFYRGDGAFGQFCMIMPQYDAVMAITSESWDMQKSMTTVWENILPALQAGSLAENPSELAELKKDLKNLWMPVVKGSLASPVSAQYSGKIVKLESNDFGALSAQFKFTDKGVSWTTKTGSTEKTINCGWERWQTNPETAMYLFPAAYRINVPSKIAGTATWVDKNTLQLNLRFVEAIHGDKVTCVFDGDKVTISFLTSMAENTKNNPEGRKPITGTI